MKHYVIRLALFLAFTFPATPTFQSGDVDLEREIEVFREKRQATDPRLAGYITQALSEANAELLYQKNLDKTMLQQGIDIPAGSQSYFWHLGRFLYTKNKEVVDVLSDKAWVIVRATKRLVELTGMPLRQLMTNPQVVAEWRKQVEPTCPFKPPTCDFRYPFRTATGYCNHLSDTTQGAALTRQRRMMFNSYEDGIDYPRVRSKAGKVLPSARLVSNIMHKAGECSLASKHFTVMIMQFGQFIEHDVISTPMISGTDGADIMCCEGAPNVTAMRSACFPISIPPADGRFTESCMTFVRSTPGLKLNCDMGIRSPMNQASAFMDGSQIYGTSEDETKGLRSFLGGMLKMTTLGLPPPSDEEMCIKEAPGDYCMLAGDFRVNHVPGLTVLHTTFLREHNRIATHLTRINPGWNDERAFQETRKIIIGMLQHMVYNELLPSILNEDHLIRYNIRSSPRGFSAAYDPDTDASIMMGFSAAAMRFPHTRIPDVQGMVDDSFSSQRNNFIFATFDKPRFILERMGQALNDFARWLISFPVMEDDRFVEDGVRDFLFLDNRGHSFDLVALNIQRARDQGIPTYNEWRKLCGLVPATFFTSGPGGLVDHEPESVRLLSTVYSDVDDIDLFTGGLSEITLPGAATGPTFACIIATQFRSLKVGDRFWYENMHPITGFTEEQLNEIKKIRLSRVMCDNLDVPFIQPNVFRFVGNGNARVSCGDLPNINLDTWKDE
ncbi:peroxidase-like [Ylistrum balloti]|uniref:peroxidase-like n=1 Tax=Ylistrum balloti TaxID=509963 RepID=UPI002905D1A9|nr:peroxidase-like [Ylistrum balloti]